MDPIIIILSAIAVLLTVISLCLLRTTFHRHFDPPGPEDEKEDLDSLEEFWRDSGFLPTDFYCGD
ncbi:hypothetical protein ES705_25054 [subsurface metagenome]